MILFFFFFFCQLELTFSLGPTLEQPSDHGSFEQTGIWNRDEPVCVDSIGLLKSHSGGKLIWISAVGLLWVCGAQWSIIRPSVGTLIPRPHVHTLISEDVHTLTSWATIWLKESCDSFPVSVLCISHCSGLKSGHASPTGSWAGLWIIQTGRANDTIYVCLTELVLRVAARNLHQQVGSVYPFTCPRPASSDTRGAKTNGCSGPSDTWAAPKTEGGAAHRHRFCRFRVLSIQLFFFFFFFHAFAC